MTSGPGEGWKVFAEGDGVDDVPLWKALAKIRSDDLNEGLEVNAAFLNRIKPTFSRNYSRAIAASCAFGFLSILSLICLVISLRSGSTDFFFYLTLAMLAVAVAPYLWRQTSQYGLTIPDAPLELPHESDKLFDEVLGQLQKADGPQAYYLSGFQKKRTPLSRRQFFGRLRYFLFSEHSKDRAMVMRYPTAMSFPADLYLHRDDVEKIIALSAPKRTAGPGRSAKYAYTEAVFDLRADSRIGTLDLNDEAASVRSITGWLEEWFDSEANVSGEFPKREQLTPYAKKIFGHLKRAGASKAL